MLRKSSWLKWSCLLAITGAYLLVLSAPGQAQKDKKVEPTKEEIQRERMQKLITAYDLAAQGRKKNAPEYLITAAGMLRQLSAIKDLEEMKALDAKPEITGEGKADQDKEVKAPSLREQSEELFKEASDMGATLNVNVDKLIKLAKERETSDKEERSVIGGPRQVARQIGPGQTHTYTYALRTNDFSEWYFQSSAPLYVSVMRGDDNATWYAGSSVFLSRVWHPNWHPNYKLKQAPIVIRITNQHKIMAQYQMTIQ